MALQVVVQASSSRVAGQPGVMVDVQYPCLKGVRHDYLVVTNLAAEKAVIAEAERADLSGVHLSPYLLAERVGELGSDQLFVSDRREGRIIFLRWRKGREDLVGSDVAEIAVVRIAFDGRVRFCHVVEGLSLIHISEPTRPY